jgi:hypothetical protein
MDIFIRTMIYGKVGLPTNLARGYIYQNNDVGYIHQNNDLWIFLMAAIRVFKGGYLSF